MKTVHKYDDFAIFEGDGFIERICSRDMFEMEIQPETLYYRNPVIYDSLRKYKRILPEFVQKCSPILTITLDNAIVSAGGVVGNKRSFTTSGQGNSFYRRALLGENPHLNASGNSAIATFDKASVEVAGNSLVLFGPGSSNFGHILSDFLGRALVFEGPRASTKCLVSIEHAGLFFSVCNLLHNAGYLRDNIINISANTSVYCEKATVVTGCSNHPRLIHPVAFAKVRHLLHDYISFDRSGRSAVQQFHLLYVGRGAGSSRQLLNEPAVIELLKDFSAEKGFRFSELDPSLSSVAEQIHAHAQADLVIGVMGAGMAGTLTSKKAADVIMLAPSNMPGGYFKNICDLNGMGYSVVRSSIKRKDDSDRSVNDDFEISLSEFVSVLQETVDA